MIFFLVIERRIVSGYLRTWALWCLGLHCMICALVQNRLDLRLLLHYYST